MYSMSIRIAGIPLHFADPCSLLGPESIKHYAPFASACERHRLQIRVRRIEDLPATALAGWTQIFAVGKYWSLFTQQDLLWFAVPRPKPPDEPYNRAAALRLICWARCQNTADLWLPGSVNIDPFLNLALPFFGAFFATCQGILVHASVVDMGGEAWLFVGPSGAGKSHWAEHCQARGGRLYSEDRVIVRLLDGQAWAFGAPWHWSGQVREPHGVPVTRIYLLRQAEPGQCRPETPGVAAGLLLRSAILPMYDSVLMSHVLSVVDALVQQGRAFRLGYAEDDRTLDL